MTIDEFIEAIKCGQGEPAALQFVAYGGDVNAPLDGSGLTPLHLAVEAENCSMIQALFNLGANVDARDANGWTPLHRAVDLDLDTAGQTSWGEGDFMRNLTFRTTELLISLGADVAARCADGRTPRDFAAAYDEDILRKYDEVVQRAQV
jgi:uncharacterized protein